MSDKLGSPYIDTEHQCTLLVTANCVKITSQLRPTEQTEQKSYDNKRDNHTDFDVSIDIISPSVYTSQSRYNDMRVLQCNKRLIFYIKWLGMNDRRHTTGKEHTSQRHDKRLYIEIGN